MTLVVRRITLLLGAGNYLGSFCSVPSLAVAAYVDVAKQESNKNKTIMKI